MASVCSLVLSDSSTFLKFWLSDQCREQLISSLPKRDLATLRLVCHDFSARIVPTLFQHMNINFKANTFTRPARLAALDRLGHYVKHLTFNLPHTPETSLPPLIHPETGDELEFTYKPQTEPGASQTEHNDEDITQLLAYQYPPLFHAATNVPAFIRGLSCFTSLAHLEISCPGSRPSAQSRYNIIDYALISLRIAIERNNFVSLNALTLSPIHATGLLSLSSLTGSGSSPASSKRWSCVQTLSIGLTSLSLSSPSKLRGQENPDKLLTSYLLTFQPNLLSLRFAWVGEKGSLPLHQTIPLQMPRTDHPSHHRRKVREQASQLYFPRIATIYLENAFAKATHLRSLALQHARTLETLECTGIDLVEGSWDEAFAPLVSPRNTGPAIPRPRTSRQRFRTIDTEVEEMAEIPIMFTPPRTSKPSPAQYSSCSPIRAIHPSARAQMAPRTPERERDNEHPARQHRAPTKHSLPKSPPLPDDMLPKKLKRVEAPLQPAKKVGILGRVARGVKRTFKS